MLFIGSYFGIVDLKMAVTSISSRFYCDLNVDPSHFVNGELYMVFPNFHQENDIVQQMQYICSVQFQKYGLHLEDMCYTSILVLAEVLMLDI